MQEMSNGGQEVSDNPESARPKNEVNETNEKNRQAALHEIGEDLKPEIDKEQQSESFDESSSPAKVLKREESDLLESGNAAINQRLEAKEDDYRDKGFSEDEIREKLAADKQNFQEEFLQDAFPGQDVSTNVFNGFSEKKLDDNSDAKLEQNELAEVREKTKEITKQDYEDARETAQNRPDGLGNYTEHTEAHVEQVAEKSEEAVDSIETSIDKGNLIDKDVYEKNEADPNRVNFESGVDKNTLEAAAISHDTGMKEGGFVLDEKGNVVKDENGDAKKAETTEEIRENHSINSAVNVLEKRDEYEKMDVDADETAVLCMAHSKSNSGVKDLNSKEDWGKCFDKIDTVVEEYNKDKSDEDKISFDRSKFENDEQRLGQLATSTFALRLGDVSRDSGEYAVSQGGGNIYVDKSTVDSKANTTSEEIKDAVVQNSETGTVESEYSKIVHVGEQNICDNRTVTGENGELRHEITVADGEYAPNCTFKAIMDHVEECETATGAKVEVDIKFDGEIPAETRPKYDEMRDKYNLKSDNVKINYPWDNE